MRGVSSPTQRWELFNTETDPSECHDLAGQHPDKLQELVALWWSEAGKYNALPLESRNALQILGTERPQLSKPRDRYVYYPGCEEVPEAVAVNIRNRSYAISAEVTIDTRPRPGVLFAHGCRFGGHALYIKDGKLKYDYNYVGEFDQYVESGKPVPAGDCRPVRLLREVGHRDADRRHAQPLHQPGEGRRGQDQDPARQVLPRRRRAQRRHGPGRAGHRRLPRRPPWAFTGGTIHKVIINVSGDPWVDREKEVQAAFARD